MVIICKIGALKLLFFFNSMAAATGPLRKWSSNSYGYVHLVCQKMPKTCVSFFFTSPLSPFRWILALAWLGCPWTRIIDTNWPFRSVWIQGAHSFWYRNWSTVSTAFLFLNARKSGQNGRMSDLNLTKINDKKAILSFFQGLKTISLQDWV